MRRISWIGILVMMATAGCAGPKVVSTGALLDEMVDLKRLMELPQPAYATRQFSSFDRGAKSPKENWFANGDCGQYLRVEEVAGRKEHVMMDAAGPGAIVRIWSANPKGVLRLYLDGASQPVIEAKMDDLLGGRVPGFPKPIAGERSAGWNLYFPIAYAKSCKVTSDEGGFYYHVNYRTYPAGTAIKSFCLEDLKTHAGKIAEIAERLSDPRKGGGPPAERTRTPFDVAIPPGSRERLWQSNVSQAICGFLVHLEAENVERAARETVLYITFDGEQTVACPIGDFFGTAPGLTPYASLPLGITHDQPPDLWCHWWMPFAREAVIEVKNLGGQRVRLHGAVAVVPYKWNDRSLLFHAKWRIERDLPSRPFSDWTHLECTGRGRFVGGALHVINPVKNWWGEGDEKIYVDGETFPSHFGTGSEDYYGYAWCCNRPFTHAYHNQPRCDGPGNYGNTSVNRFHIIDDIPFDKSFKFDIENWHSHDRVKTTRAAVSYWYARPGGTDFFKPLAATDVELRPIAPYQARRVPGAIEGEKMKVLEKTGNVGPQPGFEFMSGEDHLYWTGGRPGDKLTVGFMVKEAGTKHVIVRLTKARDYAVVQLHVNGAKAGQPIDLYNPDVVGTEEIDLGAFELQSGQNTLTIEIVGANEKAIKAYMAGLDYILVK